MSGDSVHMQVRGKRTKGASIEQAKDNHQNILTSEGLTCDKAKAKIQASSHGGTPTDDIHLNRLSNYLLQQAGAAARNLPTDSVTSVDLSVSVSPLETTCRQHRPTTPPKR